MLPLGASTTWLWLLLRGYVTLWTIWIARNHCVFQHEIWSHKLATLLIWKGLGCEYARAAWFK
jgi:hypothetical protein